MSETYSHDGSDAPDGDRWGKPVEPQPPPPARRRRSLLARRVTWRTAVLVIAAVAALRLWVVESAIVDGLSMARTLAPNEWVLVLKPLKPHRFSVVTLVDPEGTGTVIKRVIGLPGDIISIEPIDSRRANLEGSRVYINGVPQYEPYVTSALPDELRATRVPEGSYYVLGDNRDNSEDSREYGPVKASELRGNGLMVIYPLSHMRIIPDAAGPETTVRAAR